MDARHKGTYDFFYLLPGGGEDECGEAFASATAAASSSPRRADEHGGGGDDDLRTTRCALVNFVHHEVERSFDRAAMTCHSRLSSVNNCDGQ